MNYADQSPVTDPTLPDSINIANEPDLEVLVRTSGTPLQTLASDIMADYGVDIWVAEPIRSTPVEVWYQGPTRGLLDIIAQQIGAHYRWTGENYVIQPGPDYLLYLPENNAADDVVRLLTEHYDIQATRIGPQVFVTGKDTPAARQVINDMGRTPNRYIVDVLVIELQSAVARELGLGWTVGTTTTIQASLSSSADNTIRYGAEALIEVIGRVAATSDQARLANRANLFLLEGETAKSAQGDRIPIPRRTISSEGVVTIVGFETVQSGFTLQARAVTLQDTSIRLDLEPTLSEVGGFVAGENPILLQRTMTSSVVVRNGEWVIIGGFDRTAERASTQGINTSSPLTSMRQRSADAAVTILAVRARRL